MHLSNPKSTASIAGRPIHAMLVPFPIACFSGALVADILYIRQLDMMWVSFAAWLLVAGLAAGALAAVAGVIDLFAEPRIRKLPSARIHAIGNGGALLLSLVNVFVHSRDGYTAVVPLGITLSAIVVAILALTSWLGWGMVHRHRVGVAP